MTVTYHDPCHLGRMGEPYIHWNGREVIDEIRTFDPPKEYRRGTYGVYEPPRDILKSIPGICGWWKWTGLKNTPGAAARAAA